MALDRREIVAAALELLDEVGLEGLSTRNLAARLGVKGPSLYWHFKSMRKLHDYMAEAMLEAVLPSSDPAVSPGAWDEWLAEGARGIRKAALSRRDGARILMGSHPTGESSISFRAMVGRLEANGFSTDEARATLVALGRYAMGCAAGDQMQGLALPSSEADFEYGLQAMLKGLAARRRAAA